MVEVQGFRLIHYTRSKSGVKCADLTGPEAMAQALDEQAKDPKMKTTCPA